MIKIRHIGNCLKADPAYGKGVADALGIPLKEVPKQARNERGAVCDTDRGLPEPDAGTPLLRLASRFCIEKRDCRHEGVSPRHDTNL